MPDISVVDSGISHGFTGAFKEANYFSVFYANYLTFVLSSNIFPANSLQPLQDALNLTSVHPLGHLLALVEWCASFNEPTIYTVTIGLFWWNVQFHQAANF